MSKSIDILNCIDKNSGRNGIKLWQSNLRILEG